MKKTVIILILGIFSLNIFSRDLSSIEELDSEVLFSMNLDSMKQLSYEEIEADFFQIRNMVKRYRGCFNKYYSLGTYTYKQNVFEILQFTNGYSVFTYLVVKGEKVFPQMLLIDMRTGSQIDITFKIKAGLVYLSSNERCGEFPIKVSEVYRLDKTFSIVESHDIPPLKEINVIPAD